MSLEEGRDASSQAHHAIRVRKQCIDQVISQPRTAVRGVNGQSFQVTTLAVSRAVDDACQVPIDLRGVDRITRPIELLSPIEDITGRRRIAAVNQALHRAPICW